MDSEEKKPAEQAESANPPESSAGEKPEESSKTETPSEDKPDASAGATETAGPEKPAAKTILLMERMPKEEKSRQEETRQEPDKEKPKETGPGGEGESDEAAVEDEADGESLQGRSSEDIDRARNRQKTFLQQRRRQKKLRVLYGRLRILIKLCFIGVLAFAIWEFATADLWAFDGRRIRLPELRLLESGEVLPVLEAYAGEPVYNVDPRQIETILKGKYPIISDLYVRRALFPARLDLTIVEKAPWGELYRRFDDERPYAVVGADYRPVLLRPYARARAAFPDEKLVKLMLPPGKHITPDYLKTLDRLTFQLDSVRGLSLGFVDARNPKSIDAYFDHVRVRIGRLDATTPERLARLAPLVPEINRLRGEIDQVDLRWLNQVAFRRGKTPLPVLGPQPEPPVKEKTISKENPPKTPESDETVVTPPPVSSVQGE